MFYKVIKDERVIDVLSGLVYVKYQKRHDKMLLTSAYDAQGIVSSDGDKIWHINYLYPFPDEIAHKYDTVFLEKIDEYEYKQLKALNMKTPEEIIDEYTLLLIERGVL